jgi:hypothetical protein
LQLFAEGRYTARQLAQAVPEEVVMASGLFERMGRKKRAEGLAEGLAKGLARGLARGLAKGRAEGLAEGARQICAQMVKEHHPAVAGRVVPVIEACADLPRLRRWALEAPRLSDEEFARLVTRRRAGVGATRQRVPRPARKARRG